MKTLKLHTGLFATLVALVVATSASNVLLADTGAEHQIQRMELGVSGGNINDITTGFCCSGTLGSLVEDSSGTQYILSNNHVLAVTNDGLFGDPIIQPGMIDQSPVCDPNPNDTVANLTDFVALKFKKGQGPKGPTNMVDAAIAEVVLGTVRSDGFILDVGLVSNNTLAASVLQSVQKSGRTTGHTTGQVSAVGVTVNIEYDEECDPNAKKLIARFVNQIRITPGTFSAGGDSGALILENGSVDPANNLPRAVGLLYAGSSVDTLANPIDDALNAFNVTLVTGLPGPTGTVAGTVITAVPSTPIAIAGATVSADTGQSDTTAADGTYSIADVPVGNRQVTASASGFESQTNPATVTENATTVDFTLNKSTQPTQSTVDCVTYDLSGGRNGNKHINITITVIDGLGGPVSGAEVRIEVFRNSSFYGSGAITNAAGEVTYTASKAPPGEYTTTVTDVISSLTFDGATPDNLYRKNVDPVPDADCRGDTPQPSGGAASGSGNAIGHAIAVKVRHENDLFAIPGVVGTGVGVNATGNPVIEVYLRSNNGNARAQIPNALEDIPTRIVVT